MNNINWFFDMCVIIFYSNPSEKYSEKVIRFVENKGNSKFLLCYYILEENLPKWIIRQKAILEEVKIKLKNPDYIIGTSNFGKLLFPKDKNKCEKFIFAALRSKNNKKFIMNLERNQLLIQKRIEHFKKLIDKKVIPISEIDFELKSSLFTFLNNDSDAKTLASGIQQHQKEELIIITGDKEHWTKDNLEWAIPEHSPLRKKYSKIPEIKYVQNL